MIGCKESISIKTFASVDQVCDDFSVKFHHDGLGCPVNTKQNEQYKNYMVQTYKIKFDKNDLKSIKICCLKIVQVLDSVKVLACLIEDDWLKFSIN